jgi:hypothetical protein
VSAFLFVYLGFVLFLAILRFWTQAFALARQVFYPLSHASSPFCCGYFWDRALLFARASLDCDSSTYASRHRWGDSCGPPCPASSPLPHHWDEVSWTYFLPGPAWTRTLLSTLPTVAGMTGTHHHIQLLVELVVSRTFCLGWLPDLSFPSRITGMSTRLLKSILKGLRWAEHQLPGVILLGLTSWLLCFHAWVWKQWGVDVAKTLCLQFELESQPIIILTFLRLN